MKPQATITQSDETKIVGINETRIHLSQLILEASQGKVFIITKAGKPMVRVTPISSEPKKRLGMLEGVFKVPKTSTRPSRISLRPCSAHEKFCSTLMCCYGPVRILHHYLAPKVLRELGSSLQLAVQFSSLSASAAGLAVQRHAPGRDCQRPAPIKTVKGNGREPYAYLHHLRERRAKTGAVAVELHAGPATLNGASNI